LHQVGTSSLLTYTDSRFDVTGEGRNACNAERHHL